MKPRLINANALMEYCQNQMDKKIDCNDIARFPTYPTDEWHYVKDGDLPKENIYLVIKLNDENTCYKYCTGVWEKEEKCFYTLFCNKVDIEDIIAWKEIVL